MRRSLKSDRFQVIKNSLWMLNIFRKCIPLYFYLYTFYVVFVAFVTVVTGSVSLKFILDSLEKGQKFENLILILLGISGLIIVRNLLGSYLIEYLKEKASISYKEKISLNIFNKAYKMDTEMYENPEFYNDFVWAASQADEKGFKIFGSYILLLAAFSDLFFLGSVMVALKPPLILISLLMSVIKFWVNQKAIKLSFEIEKENKPYERERDYSQRIFYLSDYAKEIRLTNIHSVLYKRFRSSNESMRNTFDEKSKGILKIFFVTDFFHHFVLTFGILLYLVYEIMVNKCLSIGDFAALSLVAMRFVNRTGGFMTAVNNFSEHSLYIEKYRNFISYKPKIEDHKGKEAPNEQGTIQFDNVSFTYSGASSPSLKNVSLIIKPNEKIAIVGYNGAGKSTLIKLLLRLYDTSKGNIFINDINIKDFDTNSYRAKFGTVFQDFQIFATSLGENVAMKPIGEQENQPIQNVLEACELEARLKELPKGIQTQLTKEYFEDGVNLSGGESQKVAISRVFYGDCPYVIMDEPSSALDPISEYRLNEKIVELGNDKTVIFISHRLSTTVMADRIYMFEDGQIIEEGSHKALMAQNGKYAEMFEIQGRYYQ